MDAMQQIFSRRLKELRKGKNLTQDELAKELGLAKTSISGYERGERYPDFNMISRIADFFGKPVDYLMGKSDLNESIDDEFIKFLYNIKDSNFESIISSWFKDSTIDSNNIGEQSHEINSMLHGFIKLIHSLLRLPVRDDDTISEIKTLLIAIVSMQGNRKFSPDDYKKLISLVPYFYSDDSTAKLVNMSESDRLNLINLNESLKQLTYNDYTAIMGITHSLRYCKVAISFIESDRSSVSDFINYELGETALDQDTRRFIDTINYELEACTKHHNNLIKQVNHIRQTYNLPKLTTKKEGDTT